MFDSSDQSITCSLPRAELADLMNKRATRLLTRAAARRELEPLLASLATRTP